MDTVARAMNWLAGDDTGISSKAIVIKMLGGKPDSDSAPSDPSDLGRCLRLLAKFPEWRGRLSEMAEVGFVWAALVARWDDLEKCMADEVGIDWSKGNRAMKTFDLMHKIEGAAWKAQPDWHVELSPNGHLRSACHKSVPR